MKIIGEYFSGKWQNILGSYLWNDYENGYN